MNLLRIISVMAWVGGACAESAGVPVPPVPGALPAGWAELGNDDFARTGHSGDDHRTSEVMAGTRFSEQVIGAFDHSTLTDRFAGTRCDELTATLGWLPFGGGEDDRPRVAVGGGVRASGSLCGEVLQNDCHRARNFGCVYLAYDDSALTAVGYVDGVWRLFPVRFAGIEAEAIGVATTYVELQGDFTLRGVLRWQPDELRAWAGLRQRAHDGRAQSQTARATAAFERGTWLEYGASWRMWSLSGGFDLGDGFSFGAIGLTVKEW